MFEAIADHSTAIQLAQDSDDPEIRASVKGQRTTGAATMHRIRATLRKALNDAIRTHRLLEFNPATHIELPSGKRPKARVWTDAAVKQWKTDGTRPSPVMVWTPAQAGRFLDYAQAHDLLFYPIYVLILHRGLRRGEAVGLREDSVDLDARYAVIRQQITTIGYTAVIKKVKSDAGDRTIALDEATVAALKAYDIRRKGWRLQGGPGGTPATGCSSSSPTDCPGTPNWSANDSRSSSRPPGSHRSGSTTCGTAPPATSKPQGPTSKTSRRPSGTPRSPSPPTPTPACSSNSTPNSPRPTLPQGSFLAPSARPADRVPACRWSPAGRAPALTALPSHWRHEQPHGGRC